MVFDLCLTKLLRHSASSLRKLDITSLRKPFYNATLDVVYQLSFLERFHLEDLLNPEGVIPKIGRSFPNLTYLNVASIKNYEIPDYEILELTNGCRKIETLQLISFQVSKDALRNIADTYNATLKRLLTYRPESFQKPEFLEIFSICKHNVFVPGVSSN